MQGNRDALMRNLVRLTRERHAKYVDTFYHLEPNVKETPGGLRDCQFIRWMEQLRDADATASWRRRARSSLQQAFRFLARLRMRPPLAGRPRSQCPDTSMRRTRWPTTAKARMCPAWMREYYRHARTVNRAALRSLEAWDAQSSALFAQFVGWRSRLSNADFGVHRERVHFRVAAATGGDPDVVLRLFEFVARHGIRPSRRGRRTDRSASGRICATTFKSRATLAGAAARFSRCRTRRWPSRSMHETGVLFALFPGAGADRMPGGARFLSSLHRGRAHPGGDPECLLGAGDLRRDSPRPAAAAKAALLLFALLFHDSGKAATPAAGHVDASRCGWRRAAMRRIHMPSQDRETVLFLIGNPPGTLLGACARATWPTRRPSAMWPHRVGTEERLKALTVLTYADISAVNPGAMTPWRSAQLWRLYLTVYRELTRELDEERIGRLRAAGQRRHSSRACRRATCGRTAKTRSPSTWRWKRKPRARRGRGDPPLESAWQLTVITGDRPGLFAAWPAPSPASA